jgi:hypothetical protein
VPVLNIAQKVLETPLIRKDYLNKNDKKNEHVQKRNVKRREKIKKKQVFHKP